MFKEGITENYNSQLNEVINYILLHLKDDLSLEKLAGIANYSPFHFQKIFKQITGTTPKQFVIKAKLEHAGFLIMHQNKPVTEIAIDCGFSSLSVFSRSFRNYFGLSAEDLRNIPGGERIKFFKTGSFIKELLNRQAVGDAFKNNNHPIIAVKKISAFRGISTNTSLQDRKIINAFRKSVQLTEATDTDISRCHFMGIIYPHQNLYRALVTLNLVADIIKKENLAEIKPGRYAAFKVKGQIGETFSAIHFFYGHWLPHSGYRVADTCVFEMLSQNPIGKPYGEIEREVYIPIEPA